MKGKCRNVEREVCIFCPKLCKINLFLSRDSFINVMGGGTNSSLPIWEQFKSVGNEAGYLRKHEKEKEKEFKLSTLNVRIIHPKYSRIICHLCIA